MKNKKGMNRRNFLKVTAAGTCGAAIHHALTPSSGMMAFADPIGAPALINSPVLIVVNLSGGMSYNAAPIYSGTYYDKNPSISFTPGQSLPLTGYQGLHPSLNGFKSAWDEGSLALFNKVGYPSPNRSHADSDEIWATALRYGGAQGNGWLARLTCQMGGMFSGISLGGSGTIIKGSCNPPRSLSSLNTNESTFKWGNLSDWFKITRDNLLYDESPRSAANYNIVKSSIVNYERSIQLIRDATSGDLPIADPPRPYMSFQRACKDAARLIKARNLGVKAIYLSKGGFDTHSGERSRLTDLLRDVDEGVNYIIQNAKALGRWNDVIIVTTSEFCRTMENGSQGTDHGHAGPMFVMGGRVLGGIKSPIPSNAEIASSGYFQNYDVAFTEPFAQIVGAMGYNVSQVIPERYSSRAFNLFR